MTFLEKYDETIPLVSSFPEEIVILKKLNSLCLFLDIRFNIRNLIWKNEIFETEM